jgi:hypothetical protein
MASVFEVPIYTDKRGSLISIEKCLPFKISRTYFIYDISGCERGGHRHKVCWQALVSINGSCVVSCNDGFSRENFIMDKPQKILILKPEDWHKISSFTKNTILVVLASHTYDKDDYIYEDYK